MAELFSPEWLELYEVALNKNDAYAKAASWWTGDFVFIVRASGKLVHDIFAFVGLKHGKCTGVKAISGESDYEVVAEGESASDTKKLGAEYTYEASYDTWISILKGELDPIRGLLSGKAKIQGNMAKVLKATDAAKELVRTAGMIDTDYF
ncbi:MAG: SCP2 sterol-binding domain-containing protein [Candidatus Thorarchaeota archaeon]|nr:SCP2 sterol-binding domain-containing protein [Candidatus Thorarchaeota archaeon]